jgi:hypothetical protein
LPVLLVLEVVEGKLAGERFEIGQDGVDIIRKPTGKFFCFFFSKKNGVDIIRKPTGKLFCIFFPKKMVLILSVSPQVYVLLPYVKKKRGPAGV